jgi:hypothetical protein
MKWDDQIIEEIDGASLFQNKNEIEKIGKFLKQTILSAKPDSRASYNLWKRADQLNFVWIKFSRSSSKIICSIDYEGMYFHYGTIKVIMDKIHDVFVMSFHALNTKILLM